VTGKKTKKKLPNEGMNRSARLHSNSPSLDQDETFAYKAGYNEEVLRMASTGNALHFFASCTIASASEHESFKMR
jgi:hypothetical protein